MPSDWAVTRCRPQLLFDHAEAALAAPPVWPAVCALTAPVMLTTHVSTGAAFTGHDDGDGRGVPCSRCSRSVQIV